MEETDGLFGKLNKKHTGLLLNSSLHKSSSISVASTENVSTGLLWQVPVVWLDSSCLVPSLRATPTLLYFQDDSLDISYDVIMRSSLSEPIRDVPATLEL